MYYAYEAFAMNLLLDIDGNDFERGFNLIFMKFTAIIRDEIKDLKLIRLAHWIAGVHFEEAAQGKIIGMFLIEIAKIIDDPMPGLSIGILKIFHGNFEEMSNKMILFLHQCLKDLKQLANYMILIPIQSGLILK